MQSRLFYRFGNLLYRLRFLIIGFWALLIAAGLPFLPKLMTPFQSTGFVALGSASDKADQYIDKHIGYNDNRFIILYQSNTLKADRSTFKRKVKKSLENLKQFPMKHEIIYPWSNPNQISKDKHTAYAVVLFKENTPMNDKQFKAFKSLIKKPSRMSMHIGGEPAFIATINEQTQQDLFKADIIAAPVSIIILILVFGTLVAALVPIALGGGCAIIILTTLFVLGHLCSLSIFTINIALLLGLCLILDYSLFIIKRFRDELLLGKKGQEALAITMATAGKAIFFSGLTVFISLSALLLFPVNILFSVGVGGLVAVAYAVAIALTLLPAVLAVLKTQVNRLAVYSAGTHDSKKARGIWRSIAKTVVKRPLFFFSTTLILLIMLGYPFMHVKFGISNHDILPKHLKSSQFFEIYQEEFDKHQLSPILIVLTTKKGKVLSRTNLSRIYNFTRKIKNNPRVKDVLSIVNTKPQLKKAQYQAMYTGPKSYLNSDLRQLLKTTTTQHDTLITVISRYEANSPQSKKLVEELRDMNPGRGLSMQISGVPANNVDVLNSISTYIPYAMIWIMTLTYLILMILLRSLFLPFKALMMNILSLCASYGVLVYVFQDGHLHQLLNFTPQGMLDISLVVIIFCALFGFSMDYEVFLLTRIQECYEETGDNKDSIIFGIVKSSRIITSAAVIVIVLCGSFMVADVLMVKAFGLGIAVAIFVDAFIIRTLFVPATMVLASSINWYIPKWLDRLLPGPEQMRHH